MKKPGRFVVKFFYLTVPEPAELLIADWLNKHRLVIVSVTMSDSRVLVIARESSPA